MKSVLIVGAGFSGAVFGRALAEREDLRIMIVDCRSHVGGNCHTARDEESQIMVHTYGPHVFHTSSVEVWNYVNRFATWMPFTNRVKAVNRRGVFSLPVNLLTINQFFNRSMRPEEARAFLTKQGDSSIQTPSNFEEQALKFLGKELYEHFFYGYTKKQWGCEPQELPASILKRLPIRFNYDDNYYADLYQGIPAEGYAVLIERIIDHPRIEVKLDTPWEPGMSSEFDHVLYTGCLDEFFGFQFGHLGYRTVFWERQTGEGDYQGNAVINYTELTPPFTRIHEHKHFAPWESHKKTLVFTEYSREKADGDIPYYPKRLAADMSTFFLYKHLAEQISGVSFLGRLATYRYLDMDMVIAEALEFSKQWLAAFETRQPPPYSPQSCTSRSVRLS